MLAIAAGYFSIVVLNSFVHLIISVYSKNEIILTGIAQFPSDIWAFGITALQFVFGLFGGLLTTTLAGSKAHIEILGFILLMIIISLIDYSVLNDREPLWYLIVSPSLRTLGIFTGYQLIKLQNNNLTQAT
jgi:hypothetical protein